MAIVAGAVVPHPPALLPGATGRPIEEIEELRAAATAAVRWVLDAEPDLVVAVAAGHRTEDTRRPDIGAVTDAFVGAPAAADGPSLGLAVVAALLPGGESAPLHWQSVDRAAPSQVAAALGAELAERAPRVALIAAGDGSARRGVRAPGYLDGRAAAFDESVRAALAGGGADALLGLDATVAAELLVAGRAPWQVLAGAVGDAAITAHVDYAADPFGVWYAVARWAVTPAPAFHRGRLPSRRSPR